MLEVVRIKVFIVQCQVRLYVIGKFDDFHIDAFFGKLILHGAEDFSVGDGGYAHFESDCPAVFQSGSRRFFSSPQPVINPVSANAATDAMIVFLNFMKNSSFDVLA